jgi:hypothetical protein
MRAVSGVRSSCEHQHEGALAHESGRRRSSVEALGKQADFVGGSPVRVRRFKSVAVMSSTLRTMRRKGRSAPARQTSYPRPPPLPPPETQHQQLAQLALLATVPSDRRGHFTTSGPSRASVEQAHGSVVVGFDSTA